MLFILQGIAIKVSFPNGKCFTEEVVTLLANSRSPSEMRIEIDRLARFSHEFDNIYNKYTELLS